MNWPSITDRDITSVRPPKNRLDPWRPYAFITEQERTARGTIEDMTTIFLTNRECPFHCTMCDLWKNTLDHRVPIGAIAAQIDYAIERLPPAKHVKLYNAGNFFDSQAIPIEEHGGIASRMKSMETVIVENHPRMTDDRALRFRDQLNGQLEIAMGLETIHSETLSNLNKRMTIDDFDHAARFLTRNEIRIRTFLLVNPPGLDREESLEWAFRSLVYAVEQGVTCVSYIPTRSGNGIMDQMASSGFFHSPTIRSMEQILERSLRHIRESCPNVRVFMDLWDVGQFYDCSHCGQARSDRLCKMNLSQQIEPTIVCDHCHPPG